MTPFYSIVFCSMQQDLKQDWNIIFCGTSYARQPSKNNNRPAHPAKAVTVIYVSYSEKKVIIYSYRRSEADIQLRHQSQHRRSRKRLIHPHSLLLVFPDISLVSATRQLGRTKSSPCAAGSHAPRLMIGQSLVHKHRVQISLFSPACAYLSGQWGVLPGDNS